jgi:Rieske Fe-S protein
MIHPGNTASALTPAGTLASLRVGNQEKMQRRNFVRACAAAGVIASVPELIGAALAQGAAKPRFYGRARLVDAGGRPVKSKALPVGQNLIFHYPFAGTPCFLLNLGRPVRTSVVLKTADARDYEWTGGTGAADSVVAYSAICAHKLTYPTREISFISYRAEKTPGNRHAQVIHCCSEHSQYDPAAGGRVLAGPAPQPLAAILLDYDRATDELYAVGTVGGEMFDEFFAKYEFRLALEHGDRARAGVEGPCVVRELADYCRQQVKC